MTGYVLDSLELRFVCTVYCFYSAVDRLIFIRYTQN